MYGVYTVFSAGKHHTYGHIRCKYTVLANPMYASGLGYDVPRNVHVCMSAYTLSKPARL